MHVNSGNSIDLTHDLMNNDEMDTTIIPLIDDFSLAETEPQEHMQRTSWSKNKVQTQAAT